MRKALLSLALACAASLSMAIGVAIPPTGSGSEPTQTTVVAGDQVTFTGPATPGSTSVEFTIKDSDGDLVYDSGQLPAIYSQVSFSWFPLYDGTYTVFETSYSNGLPVGTSTVVYLSAVRPDATGFTTGGGWFNGPNGRDSFGFVGQVVGNGRIKGSLEFQDHGTGANVKSSLVDWVYAPDPGHAYMGGLCTLNGSGYYRFFLEVNDRGEPGTHDDLSLWVYDDTGKLLWSYRRVLDGGNIQIHAK